MEKRKFNIDDKIAVVRFKVDKNAHITVETEKCLNCTKKPCVTACPVGNYSDQNDSIAFNFEGCLECGTCRFICPRDAIQWSYPRGGFGVSFRRG